MLVNPNSERMSIHPVDNQMPQRRPLGPNRIAPAGCRRHEPMHPRNQPPARARENSTISKPLIAAIAHELWKLHGGNDVLNWLEAEMLLQNALAADECDALTERP